MSSVSGLETIVIEGALEDFNVVAPSIVYLEMCTPAHSKMTITNTGLIPAGYAVSMSSTADWVSASPASFVLDPRHSKKIYSARETVNILDILVKNFNKLVPNTDLPPSSYVSDRNEFQSKILSPLSKITKEKFNKKFPIKIVGNNNEFSLKLEKGIGIHVVEKMF